MDWAKVKFILSTMTAEQLRHPAKVYDPYFKRVIPLEGMDTLASLLEGNPKDSSSPVVLIASESRE